MASALGILLTITGVTRADTNIVWSDEFNGTTLNTNNWIYGIGNGVNGFGDAELEYYSSSPQNVYVTNGFLHVVALTQATNGFSYTSGKILTQGLFYKEYGRFDFRAQLPAGAGLWPAFWMLSENSPYGGEPNNGEIDVMENLGNQTNSVNGTIHYGGYEGMDYQIGTTGNLPHGQTTTDFHVYTLNWTSNKFEWLIDGNLYETQTNWFSNIGTSSATYPYPAPFNTPFYIIMEMAVGGEYTGIYNTNTINASLPAEMLVDYVRVYDQTEPLQISIAATNGGALLSWPTNIACHLQSLTNWTGLQGGTNWFDVAGATNPQFVIPSQGGVFFRLASP
jgi:beta-glucanase (GH16 family)